FTYLTNDSVNLYGTREQSESYQNYNYINNDTDALHIAKGIVEQNESETSYLTFSAPYWKKGYRDLEVYDIIEIEDPDLPAIAGTAPEGEAHLPTYNTQPILGVVSGHAWRRAKRYKMRILTIDPQWALGDEPTITFRVQILDKKYEVTV
ncbi:MAG: hypothetical protein KDC82_07510, partial [Bacteroidetes bacterium]|nr:hypothetical protein [Bacteroidota bacterium]